MSEPIDRGSAVVVKPGEMVLITVPERHTVEAIQALIDRLRVEHPNIDFLVVGEGTTAQVVSSDVDLDNVFTYHAPKEGDPEAYGRVRFAGHSFALAIMADVPASRERDLAVERIREAVMWANAGRACHPE